MSFEWIVGVRVDAAAIGSIEDAVLSALGAHDRGAREEVITGAARVADPEDLISAVADQNDAIRRNAAIEALVRAGPRGIPTVVRSLSHRDPEVVMFAAGILGRTRDPAAVPHLIGLIHHEDTNIAQGAIDSLSQLRSAVAVDPLISILDGDPWLRFAAIHALGAIGDGRAVKGLVPLLEDESVADVVIDALGRIGSIDALEVLGSLLAGRRDDAAFEVCLRAIGDALHEQPDEQAVRRLPAWRAMASSEEVHLSLLKILSAGDDGTPAVDSALGGAAAEIVRVLRLRPLYGALVKAGREPSLRDHIQFCVLAIGFDMGPALAAGIKSPSPHVRVLACDGIGAIGLRDRGAAVQPLLSDPQEDVRLAAVGALARLKYDPAVPSLVRLLTSRTLSLRAAAEVALGDMSPESVTTALLADAQVLDAARPAVIAIMTENPHPSQRAFVEASLQHPDAAVRRAAVAALARQPSLEVVDAVAPLLGDASVEVRREVVIALGASRSTKARELLLDQIARDPETRAFAVRSLGELGDATVVPLLIAMFEREPPMGRLAIIEALAELKQHAAEPLLVRVLGDPDPEVRRTAVQALGRFATAVAIRHVVAAARDPEWQVRAAVLDLLSPGGDAASVAALERLCLDPHPFVASQAKRRVEEHEAA